MDHALSDRLDRNYRWQRHVYDLTREHYLLGRDALIAGLSPPRHGSVLEIGCGTGRNLMRAAERYPLVSFFGIDLSRAMLETARRKLATHPCRARIRLAHADATSFEGNMLFGRQAFDRVYFSYALSMIPPWQHALQRAAASVATGGSLHVVDFGPGDGLPRLAVHALRRWLAQFHVEPRDDLTSELRQIAAQTDADLHATDIARGYATLCVLRSQ